MHVLDRFIPERLREDLGSLRRGRVLVGTAFGLASVVFLGMVVRLQIADHPRVATGIGFSSAAIFALVPFLLRGTGSLRLAGLLSVAGLFLLVVGMGWFVGGIAGPVLMVAPLFPFLTTFLFGARLGILATVLMVIAILVLAGLPLLGVDTPPSPLSGLAETQARGLTLSLTLIVAGLLAILYEQQRRFAEERLRRSEDLYRRVFSQSKDLVVLTTPAGELIDINQAGAELYGYRSRDEMTGWRAMDAYADPSQRRELLDHLETRGHVQNYETVHRTREGELRILQGTSSTVRDASGAIEFLLAILRDVTDKRHADAEREQMLAELARKNAELEDFTYAVSHDLRSPLTTVRGFLSLLERQVQAGNTEKIRSYMQTMDRAAQRMSHMLEDLLELSRIGKLESTLEDISVEEVAHEAVGLVAGRIRESGATVEIEPGLPKVHGDRQLLLAIIQNLVDNAVKFSSDQEHPQIRIGSRPACPVTGKAGEPVFFVQDNGQGIAEAHRERVFGVFRQLDARSEGTGIGLATVQRAVETHGGKVWVESDGPGQGSTFCFILRDSVRAEEAGD